MPADPRDLAEAVPVPVSVLQAVRDDGSAIVDFVIEYMNPAGEGLVGVPRDQLIGRRMKEVVPGIEQSGLLDDYSAVVAEGGTLVKGPFPFEGEVAGRTLSGYFDQHVAKYQDGVIVLSLDATASVRAHETAIDIEAALLERQASEARARELAENVIQHIAKAREAVDSGQLDRLQEILDAAQQSSADVISNLGPAQ